MSVSENIDETPSGMLLHGIMASIAEFYSMNLAAEVMKGTTEKARRGGTPFQAPVRYLNVREMVNGHEVRTIAADLERGPLIARAFQLYASGSYSTSELTAIMEAEGLRSRVTPQRPASVLGNNDICRVLRNDYYIGVVRYAGGVSEGRHPKLVDEDTFETVQGLLSSRRVSGERNWRHHSYLRGSVFCGDCGSRLIYTRATGRNGGTYEYFVCHGKNKKICGQPQHRVEAVEKAIEREYARVQLTSAAQDKIRGDVHAYASQLDGQSEPQRRQIEGDLKRLGVEERKLLDAHYHDQISPELFAEEQRRIRQERIAAERRRAELDVDHGKALKQLDADLAMPGQVQAAYLLAEPNTRRLFNQAIFEGIWIDREEIARTEINSPFSEMVNPIKDGSETAQRSDSVVIKPELAAWNLEGDGVPDHAGMERTRNQVSLVTGSNVNQMVDADAKNSNRGGDADGRGDLWLYQCADTTADHGKGAASAGARDDAPRHC